MVRMKKERGQWRKLQKLLERIDKISWEKIDNNELYVQFHVPSSTFIQYPKTKISIKRQFCRAWELKTEDLIKSKPSNTVSSKVVSIFTFPDLWCSEITIFNDEEYYYNFFNRQEWSFEQTDYVLLKNIAWVTDLPKQMCIERFEEGNFEEYVFIGEFPNQ